MNNADMYCLCLHNKVLPIIKKLGYLPVGLGNDKFSSDWLRDNTLQNISHKNKFYGEYTFHYWFWKNILPKIEDNRWIGFCAYREFWGNKNEGKGVDLECQECGKKFSKPNPTGNTKCPKCGSHDLELGEAKKKRNRMSTQPKRRSTWTVLPEKKY